MMGQLGDVGDKLKTMGQDLVSKVQQTTGPNTQKVQS